MLPDESKKALMRFFEAHHRNEEKFIPAKYEHLVEAQLNIILKKGKGAWDKQIAKQYVEHDFPNLFVEMGSSD